MLPALLYLTVRNPPWYVWVLNISIAVVYFAVAVLGSIGAVRFIVLVRFCTQPPNTRPCRARPDVKWPCRGCCRLDRELGRSAQSAVSLLI